MVSVWVRTTLLSTLAFALAAYPIATDNEPDPSSGHLRRLPRFGAGFQASPHASSPLLAHHARRVHATKSQEPSSHELDEDGARAARRSLQRAQAQQERGAAADAEPSDRAEVAEASASAGAGQSATEARDDRGGRGATRRAHRKDRGRQAQAQAEEEDSVDQQLLDGDHAAATETGMEHADHVAGKVAKTDLAGEFDTDLNLFTSNFLPGWHLDPWLGQMILTSVAVTLAWFAFYFGKVFRSDGARADGAWADGGVDEVGTPRTARGESTNRFLSSRFSGGLEADFVIVVPHPSMEHADDKEALPRAKLDSILPPSSALKADVDLSKLLQHPADGTLGEARRALLEDLCETLPKIGFDCEVYSTAGKEQLFLCVTLKRPSWVHHYLLWEHKELMVHRSVVDALKLGSVDPVASYPPFMRFDPWLVGCLHEANVIPVNKPGAVFAVHDNEVNKEANFVSIIAQHERIRIIFQHICRSMDLDSAKSIRLISDWYPAHNSKWVSRLSNVWANPETFRDFTFDQPITLVKNYFGSRVGFAFAWMGSYCKCLVALLPLAISWEVMTKVFAVPTVLIASIGIVIWAKVAANVWERDEQFLLQLWNIKQDEDQSTVRPQFKGKPMPSTVDGNRVELTMPSWEANLRMIVSSLVTVFFCVLVALCIFTWVSIFDGRMNFVASICLVILIKTFEFIWNRVADILTNWENHKFMPDHYSSFLWKQVAFQFVNNYWAFLFLATKQRYSERGCPGPGGCLELLRRQLISTLLILSFVRIFEVVGATLLVKFLLWRETRARRMALGREPPKDCFIEEQSKYGEFRIREQIQMILQPIISLGYVILFGGVAPIIVPFVLAVFMVQLRASAFLLVATTKRTVPRIAFGIGAWKQVTALLRAFGAVFASYLLAVYGAMFAHEAVITRLVGMFGFCIFIGVLWRLVDTFLPATSQEAHLLERRRNYVKNAFLEVCAKITHARTEQDDSAMLSSRSECRPSAHSAAIGDWSSIPTLPEGKQ